MAKQWIKVKDLSRDLGVTSRAIIDRCRDHGHPVQNNVTRLRPDIERAVRAWFGKGDAPTQAPRDSLH